jgi:transaldolase
MKTTRLLHNLGQSIWLDNITRDLLISGTLTAYIDELSVTGLTSNPTIFDHAIKNSSAYDASISEKLSQGKSGEALFFELALEDITRAASQFRPVYERTQGVDGWVSLEVSPLLAHDAKSTLAAARDLHARAATPNLFIKIRGPRRDCPRLRKQSLPESRSTSHCCFLASSIWPLQKHICAVSRGVSTRALGLI